MPSVPTAQATEAVACTDSFVITLRLDTLGLTRGRARRAQGLYGDCVEATQARTEMISGARPVRARGDL